MARARHVTDALYSGSTIRPYVMPSRFIRTLRRGAIFSASLILYVPAAGPAPPLSTVRGVVAGISFVPPSAKAPSTTSTTYFRHARVCFDANDNGACESSESSTFSDDGGGFVLTGAGLHPVVAEIDRADASAAVPGADRLVFRAAPEAAGASTPVAVTPLSTEIMRLMEADDSTYEVARAELAQRLGISAAEAAADPAAVTAPTSRGAVLAESVALSRRFGLAAKMVDRHDIAPATRAKNSKAAGPAMTMNVAQQAAMALEGIPRYDSYLHHRAREQGGVCDQKVAARAAHQRVSRQRQRVHQLLRDRQSERAEPHRGIERRRLRCDRRQRMELRARGKHRGPAGGHRARRPRTLHEPDESQSEGPGQPLHRDDRRRPVVADVQRVDESWPGLAAERSGRSGARRPRSHVSGRQPGRRDRHEGPVPAISPVVVHDQAQQHGGLSGCAELTGLRQEQPHARRRAMGRRYPAQRVDARRLERRSVRR